MTSDIDKYNKEFNDLDFPDDQSNSSALDQYGVWIKKRPEESFKENIALEEESILSFEDFDDTNIFNEDELSLVENKTENEEIDMDIENFEELDMNGFLDEAEDIEAEKNTESGISNTKIESFEGISGTEENGINETPLDLDIDFSNEDFDSENIKRDNDNFDSMLNDFEAFSLDTESSESEKETGGYLESEATDDVSEFDDMLDSLNSNSTDFSGISENESKDIDLNIDVDETSDITSIADQKYFDEDTITITPPLSDVNTVHENAENHKSVEKENSFVIKNTVIEPENINEIREENRKILYDGKTPKEDIEPYYGLNENIEKKEDFNDIEALTKELMEDSPSGIENFSNAEETNIEKNTFASNPEIKEKEIHSSQAVKETNTNGNLDKATEILMQIATELSTIKDELSNLKTELSAKTSKIAEFTAAAGKGKEQQESKEKQIEESSTGFFMDSDSDETIALTGDELNNILITADFTDDTKGFDKEEETENEERETINLNFEEKAPEKESSPENMDSYTETESFEIPEESDLSITENEEAELAKEFSDMEIEPSHINSSDHDFTYLDEDDTDNSEKAVQDFTKEDFSIEEPCDIIEETEELTGIPDSQEIELNTELYEPEEPSSNLKESREEILKTDKNLNKTSSGGLKNISSKINNPENSDEKKLPPGLTKEIKSVLAYMDQLLESLPDNKIKEFAESEYFDKYNRIFDELGIS